jgi:hypothetical protein
MPRYDRDFYPVLPSYPALTELSRIVLRCWNLPHQGHQCGRRMFQARQDNGCQFEPLCQRPFVRTLEGIRPE